MVTKKEVLVEGQETPGVKDLTEAVKEVSKIIRENYLNSYKLPLSLWEENLKVLNMQVEQWHKFQQDYISAVIESYDGFPRWNNIDPKGTNGHFEHLVAMQKNYISFVTGTSNSFTKGILNLIQENIEKANSILDNYLNLFKV